jgi:hypothetical protein
MRNEQFVIMRLEAQDGRRRVKTGGTTGTRWLNSEQAVKVGGI